MILASRSRRSKIYSLYRSPDLLNQAHGSHSLVNRAQALVNRPPVKREPDLLNQEANLILGRFTKACMRPI